MLVLTHKKAIQAGPLNRRRGCLGRRLCKAKYKRGQISQHNRVAGPLRQLSGSKILAVGGI